MLALGHELRAAARQLLRARRYSLAVVLTLAIGIGACGAIFTVVRGVLLRPLPYRQPGQLMLIKERIPPFSQQAWGGSAPDIGPLTRDQRVFSGVASFGGDAFDLSGGGGAPERVAGARVAWNLFPLLGVRPLLGRTFTRQEDIGAAPVALLSDGVAAPRQSARDCGWSSTWLTCSNSAERRGRAESAG
ncbi:MAG: ABC transporter permease [Terriglobales bacterium]